MLKKKRWYLYCSSFIKSDYSHFNNECKTIPIIKAIKTTVEIKNQTAGFVVYLDSTENDRVGFKVHAPSHCVDHGFGLLKDFLLHERTVVTC